MEGLAGSSQNSCEPVVHAPLGTAESNVLQYNPGPVRKPVSTVPSVMWNIPG